MTSPAPRPAQPATAPGAAPAVELRGVRKTFDGRAVLDDVDLVVAPGARVGVLGAAASGKSLLLRLLCGLIAPDVGAISVLGEEVTGRREAELGTLRRRLGVLFQSYALFDFLTVAGNVAFPLEQRGEADPATIAAAVAQRLRAVGLAGSEARWPSELSGGMKKRVGIARATICAPELLLYDEPTAGLDPVTSRKIFDLLDADQRATGATVLAVSSDVPALLGFVDEVVFLHAGRVHHRGPVAALPDARDPVLRAFLDGEAGGAGGAP
ncbi:MAG: ATP-binding cassette domain-containing protein [Kofleriaceae bacterium]